MVEVVRRIGIHGCPTTTTNSIIPTLPPPHLLKQLLHTRKYYQKHNI